MSAIQIKKIIRPTDEGGPSLRLELVGAPEDGHFRDEAYQRELIQVEQGFRNVGIRPSPQVYAQRAADAGSWLTGTFAIQLAQVAAAPAFTFLGVWLQSRIGRKVRIKIDDFEAEAATVEEVERLMDKAKAFRAEPGKKVP